MPGGQASVDDRLGSLPSDCSDKGSEDASDPGSAQTVSRPAGDKLFRRPSLGEWFRGGSPALEPAAVTQCLSQVAAYVEAAHVEAESLHLHC